MYPIIVFPKPVWADADPKTILEAIREMRMILGYCITEGCNGKMVQADPELYPAQSGTKMQCTACRSVQWTE